MSASTHLSWPEPIRSGNGAPLRCTGEGVTVSLNDITSDLATIRESLARYYQLNGMAEDQAALAEAIACVAAAEERVRRALSVGVG